MSADEYQVRLQRLLRRARQLSMVIFIWGPGEEGEHSDDLQSLCRRKRLAMREVIQDLYPNSDVLFSEDEGARVHTRRFSDLLFEERIDAEVADVMLILDVGRGASFEFDRYSANPRIARKMAVLIPKKYVGTPGLIGRVHKDVTVRGFDETDLRECRVASETCPTIVDHYALSRLMDSELWI